MPYGARDASPRRDGHCRHAVEIGKREGFANLLLDAARSLRPSVWISQVPDPLALEALEQALKLLTKRPGPSVPEPMGFLPAFLPTPWTSRAAGR